MKNDRRLAMEIRLLAPALLCATCLALTPLVSAQVIITEVMYNPASTEGGFGPDAPPTQTEWLEIYNTGDEPVDISGWYLQDEDGKTEGVPNNTTLEPGQAIVFIPGDQTVGDFRAAWGTGFKVAKLDGWGLGDGTLDNLANGPSATNEILTLRNVSDEIIDEVNYDDETPWPSDSPHGSSIVLKPTALSAEDNDNGENWLRAVVDELGAKACKVTEDYNREDVGSPGVVEVEESGE